MSAVRCCVVSEPLGVSHERIGGGEVALAGRKDQRASREIRFGDWSTTGDVDFDGGLAVVGLLVGVAVVRGLAVVGLLVFVAVVDVGDTMLVVTEVGEELLWCVLLSVMLDMVGNGGKLAS